MKFSSIEKFPNNLSYWFSNILSWRIVLFCFPKGIFCINPVSVVGNEVMMDCMANGGDWTIPTLGVTQSPFSFSLLPTSLFLQPKAQILIHKTELRALEILYLAPLSNSPFRYIQIEQVLHLNFLHRSRKMSFKSQRVSFRSWKTSLKHTNVFSLEIFKFPEDTIKFVY